MTNQEKIPDILNNCAANNEEIRVVLDEMQEIVARSGSKVLETTLQEYSVVVLDFIATLEAMADSVKAGDVEAGAYKRDFEYFE